MTVTDTATGSYDDQRHHDAGWQSTDATPVVTISITEGVPSDSGAMVSTYTPIVTVTVIADDDQPSSSPWGQAWRPVQPTDAVSTERPGVTVTGSEGDYYASWTYSSKESWTSSDLASGTEITSALPTDGGIQDMLQYHNDFRALYGTLRSGAELTRKGSLHLCGMTVSLRSDRVG